MLRLRRPIYDKQALVEAVLLFVGTTMAIIQSAVYSNDPFGNREVVLLVMAIAVAVFFYSWRAPRVAMPSRKVVINDILLATGVALGPQYRLNIMKPVEHADDAKRCFGFLCHFQMNNVHRYKDRIRLSTPGVGQAYVEQRLVHVGPSQVDKTLDEFPEHVWSINVEGCDFRCVLNIDTNQKNLGTSHIDHVSKVIKDLAKAIEKYSPAQLAFE